MSLTNHSLIVYLNCIILSQVFLTACFYTEEARTGETSVINLNQLICLEFASFFYSSITHTHTHTHIHTHTHTYTHTHIYIYIYIYYIDKHSIFVIVQFDWFLY